MNRKRNAARKKLTGEGLPLSQVGSRKRKLERSRRRQRTRGMNLGCRRACTKISECNFTRGEAVGSLCLCQQQDLTCLRPARLGDLGRDLDLGIVDRLSP